MTTYSIIITGDLGTYDITSRTTGATIARSLNDNSATLDVRVIQLAENHCMDTITLTVNGIVRFQGIVKAQSDDYNETVKVSTLKCIDKTDNLQRLIVYEQYANKTAKQIIQSIRDKYAPWLSIADVQDIGGAIEQITFNYDTFAAVIDKLAEITGAYWNVDADNNLQFFQDNLGFSPITFTPDKIIEGSFSLDTTATDIINRVWVIGAKQASGTTIVQKFTGDGNNQYYSLAYTPNYPSIKENGVTKTIEVDKGGTTTANFLYNKQEKVIKRVAGNLPSGAVIEITYQPTVQVIDYFEDPPSVAKYGLYEKAIRDKKITDKMAARLRGISELKKVKKIRRLAKWTSRDWLVNAGELVPINLPTLGIASNWLIQSVDIDFSPEDIIASYAGEEMLS